MKIKFSEVKPGMVIKGRYHFGLVLYVKKPGKYDSFFLDKPYVYMYDADDPYFGPTYSEYKPDEEVSIIESAEATKIIKETQKAQRKAIGDIEDNLRLIDIIMEK